MARKRIPELTTASDTQGKRVAVDVTGAGAAEQTPWPFHVVSTLPGSPVAGQKYYLTSATGSYPKGVYMYGTSGWICETQLSTIALSDWTAVAVAPALISGVVYSVAVTGAPTSFAPTVSDLGSAVINVSNPSTLTIPDPATGKKRKSTGLDDLSAAEVELVVSNDGSELTYSAVEIVSV